MTNLGYVVEVFSKAKFEKEGIRFEIDYITTHEDYYKFLNENFLSAEHIGDEIIDGITHMYYMV